MNNWQKKVVSWKVGKTLYLSTPFSWMLREAESLAKLHKGPVEIGGPAAVINRKEIKWAEVKESCDYDVLSMHNPLATFTTRGCIRSCKFCAVPKIEGEFRELKDWKPNPVVCDNNFLAASDKHIKRSIDKLKVFPYVDFNQGLDARIFTDFHAEQLARLKGVKVRFALDHSRSIDSVQRAVERARKAGLKDFGIYVLIGFKDTPEDALDRLEAVRSWGVLPNPMRYQPLDAIARNSYVGSHWTELELRRMMRYYSRLIYLGHVPFSEYQHGDEIAQENLAAQLCMSEGTE